MTYLQKTAGYSVMHDLSESLIADFDRKICEFEANPDE